MLSWLWVRHSTTDLPVGSVVPCVKLHFIGWPFKSKHHLDTVTENQYFIYFSHHLTLPVFYGKLKMYKVAWFAEYTLVSSLNHLSWIISSMSIQFDVVYHLQSKLWETLWRWQTSLWQTDKIYWKLNQLKFLNSIRSNRTTLKKP